MKTVIIFLQILLLLFAFPLFGQINLTGKIQNLSTDQPAKDIFIFIFGADNPVKIGEISESGNISITFPQKDPASFDPGIKELSAKELSSWTKHIFCDNPDHFPDSLKDIIVYVYEAGTIRIEDGERSWETRLYPVTDEWLADWLYNSTAQNPVPASYFEVLYLDQDVDLNTTCTFTSSFNDLVSEFNYNLQLKKGVNLIEYKIEELHEIDDEITSAPTKVSIVNAKVTDNIQWLIKYNTY